MSNPAPLKDGYDEAYITRLSRCLSKASTSFDKRSFKGGILGDGWDDLELKARMARITLMLDRHLPSAFSKATRALDRVVAEFDGYIAMFFPAFVEVRAMRDPKRLWQAAQRALASYTRYSSSEFAVRPFIMYDADRMMAQMLAWASDSNHHVRRLASEGCRPRLPWAPALPTLKKDPAPILPILKTLKDDESEYVRRSVANNLNDISKDNPEVVLETAACWLDKTCSLERRRLVKHGLRTLLKQGHPEALRLFGFREPAAIRISNLMFDKKKVTLGDDLSFTFDVACDGPLGKVRLEYAVYYVKKNGSHSRKIFQLSEFDTEESSRQIKRRQKFTDYSTRKHYAGRHELAIVVNGVESSRAAFDLVI